MRLIKQMHEIAVLIPTHMPKSYIERCLSSIDSQTCPKHLFKVYIALNGPHDNYYSEVKQYLSKMSFSFEFFYLVEANVSNARNYLLDISIEPLVVFIDDDDLISSNYLESLYYVTDLSVMGISNIVNFEGDLNSLKSNYIGRSFLKLNDTEGSKIKTRKYYSSPVAKMLHRKMIGNTRFNTHLTVGEDSLFMAEISERIESIKKTNDDVLYYVCEREGSATRTKVNKPKEVKRIAYLTHQYSKMFFSKNFNKPFILTRILATMKHLQRIF